MSDIEIDIAADRPPRLAVAVGDQVVWDSPGPVVRIRGTDLSDVARKAAAARRDDPDVDVVADIDVVIAAEACTARAMLAAAGTDVGDHTMLYVGTPAGLAGLIADMQVLGIADGAVMIPRAAGVADLIRDAVLPVLDTMAPLAGAARPA